MTIREIRKEFKERIRFSKMVLPELVEYHENMQRTFEDLWKNGTTQSFSNEFLRFANGYQINTGDYENLHILQTLDLRRITANHKAVKGMMEAYLR
jgi:hypothetical protein